MARAITVRGMGGAIVRNYARTTYGKRMRTAYQMGRFVYNNRSKIRAATRVIRRAGRAYLKRRKTARENFSPTNVGKPIGTSDCKIREVCNELATEGTRTLRYCSLVEIPSGRDDTERERAVANLSGIKIAFSVDNLKATTADIMYFNFAVIAPKDNNCIAPVTEGTDLAADFFNTQGGVRSQRNRDFNTTLTALEFRSLPINTDKYVVLRHRRIKLMPRTNEAMGKYQRNLDMYIKMNRQMQWKTDEGEGDLRPLNPVFAVWWGDFVNADDGTAGQANAFTRQIRVVNYFRDPK